MCLSFEIARFSRIGGCSRANKDQVEQKSHLSPYFDARVYIGGNGNRRRAGTKQIIGNCAFSQNLEIS